MLEYLKVFLEPSATLLKMDFQPPRTGDAGYDLFASEAVTLFAGEQKLVPTGLRMAIPEGLVGLVRDRSSIALKQIYTHAGVIDSSFRGVIGVMLENRSDKNFHIEPGDRIAQLLLLRTAVMPIVQVTDPLHLGTTARGEGAFGSTGK